MRRTGFSPKPYDEVIANAVLKQLAKLEAKKNEPSQASTKPRNPLKRAILKPAKRVKGLRKESKQKISLLQKKLWAECKRIIRARYPHTCYTCGALNLEGSNLHTGHMLAKASVGAILKYDLRLLRPQCYLCNIRHGGRGADFIENMRRIEGNEYVDSILEDREKTIKAYDHYLELLEKYKVIHS